MLPLMIFYTLLVVGAWPLPTKRFLVVLASAMAMCAVSIATYQ